MSQDGHDSSMVYNSSEVGEKRSEYLVVSGRPESSNGHRLPGHDLSVSALGSEVGSATLDRLPVPLVGAHVGQHGAGESDQYQCDQYQFQCLQVN